jgi:hypothetical protein
MVDEIQLALIVALVTIGVPVLVITSAMQQGVSEIAPVTSLHQGLPGDGLLASEEFLQSNPESAMYLMYDAQAREELEKCFEPVGINAELCGNSIQLIAKSCALSTVELKVCNDPRLKGLAQDV